MADRIGIIGEADSILAFKAIGVETFGVSSPVDAEDYIKEMSRKDFKVIFITETLAEKLKAFLKTYKSRTYPAIIPIPAGESTGFGMKGIKEDMEKAIGADILFRED